MEIRIKDNGIPPERIQMLKEVLDDFFKVDFNVVIQKGYIYMEEN